MDTTLTSFHLGMDYAHPSRKPIWHCWSAHRCRQHLAGATRGQGDLQPIQRHELAFGITSS